MFIPQGRRSIASLFVIALFTLAGLGDYISTLALPHGTASASAQP
ncbi:hypothetical protein [Pseudooceanicola sediminis]|nr:hypothetical protein [Pseudooceanicola sediminis]|tara:strand:+ start:39829 stop:39963 length:135 start_codon:yes stop_codon:yes gene_type:complete